MQPPRTKLHKWIKSMNKDMQDEEANGIVDKLYIQLLPYSKKLNFDINQFVGTVINDTACNTLPNFKKICNFKIQQKIKHL